MTLLTAERLLDDRARRRRAVGGDGAGWRCARSYG